MSEDKISAIPGTHNSVTNQILKTQEAQAKQKMANLEMVQEASQDEFNEWSELSAFNPMAMRRKFEPLENKLKKPGQEESKKADQTEQDDLSEAQGVEQTAEDYHQRNQELQKKTLLIVRSRLSEKDSPDEMMQKISETYKDPALADEVLDFLIETTENKEEIRKKLIQAKETFNSIHGREIRAGRNIGIHARNFSRTGLGSPSLLRKIYQEITGKPLDPHKLFEEMTEKFQYSQMKNIIDFILHSLGTDLKAKGPSISRGELQTLFVEARIMQAILSLYNFFKGRMSMIQGQFDREELTMPGRITFELLAKLLMKLLKERYPSPDKILRLAMTLGISQEIAAQVIIFTHYRDAMRHVSPRLFQSERHRQDLLMTLMETLSDLEEEEEEEEEE